MILMMIIDDILIFFIDMKKLAKIYQLKNLITNFVYIGVTTNIVHRMRRHKHDFKSGNHISLMQAHYDTYGPSSFELAILDECSIEVMLEVEKAYIKHISQYRSMYNAQHTGNTENNDYLDCKLSCNRHRILPFLLVC